MSARPLEGRVVVVTRAPEQAGELSDLLRAAGARVVEVPTLVMVPVSGDEAARAQAAAKAAARGEYDGALFTSKNAVAFFHEVALAHGLSASHFASLPLFAIGPATARALVERGYEPPVVAGEAVGEGLVTTLRETLGLQLAGKRLLFPRAREARDVVVEGLRAAGADVDLVVLYETRPVTGGPGLPAGVAVDWITFASPSAVRAFHQRFGGLRARVACIGPVTAKAARELGMEVAAMGAEHTAPGLVAAMIEASRG